MIRLMYMYHSESRSSPMSRQLVTEVPAIFELCVQPCSIPVARNQTGPNKHARFKRGELAFSFPLNHHYQTTTHLSIPT